MVTFVYPANGLLDQFISLGISFLGAFLKERGHKVRVIDMRIHSKEELIKAAKESEFIGFSVMTLYMSKALEYAALCKQYNPEVKIIFGGPHPTISPIETLKNKQVDFVVIGEGEETILDIVGNRLSSEKIKGIAYRNGESIKINERREYVQNLDSLPFPDRELFPVGKIFKKTPFWPSIIPYPEISMISTRGCPFNCLFCQPTLRSLFGNKVRKRSATKTVDEMELIYKKYNPASIFMADDLFTQDRNWVLDICQKIRERKLHKKLIWSCECRADTFNDEIAKVLKQSGCYMVWLGIESYSQKTLNTLRKGTKVEQNLEAIRICQRNRLISLEQIMIGNPDETLRDLKETEELSRIAQADLTAAAITSPIPGSDLYSSLKKDNLLLINNLDELGARFKGGEKFKLLYSKKQLDEIHERLKRRGEISLWLIITRNYYRNIVFKRMLCHIKSKNFISIIVDLGRIIYGALPFWLYRRSAKLVNYFRKIILSQKS